MPLIDPVLLDLFLAERELDTSACARKLRRLQRLMERYLDGTLARLSETRVEQSFNEQLFATIFDYRTLLRHGSGHFHLLPKLNIFNKKVRYDDFSLGFFSAKHHRRRLVSCELKSLGTSLDRPGAQGLSPVAQAFSAAPPSAEWILVSDFDVIRLYRRHDQSMFAEIRLTELQTERDLQKAYAILGRRNLLGDRRSGSPLLRLLTGGPPVLLPPDPARPRLMHVAHADATDVRPFHEIDDQLRGAIDKVTRDLSWPAAALPDPGLENDRLVVSANGIRIEVLREGVVTLQEYVPNKAGALSATGAGVPETSRVIEAVDVLTRVTFFALFAGIALRRGPGAATMTLSWNFTELDGAASYTPLEWLAPGSTGLLWLRCPAARPTITFKSGGWATNSTREHLIGKVQPVIRELLFPFSSTSDGRTLRARPTPDAVREALKHYPIG